MRSAWRVLRWLCPVGLLAVLAPAWGTFLLGGGRRQIVAYYFVQLGSWVALAALVLVGGYAALRRRRSSPVLVSLGLALVGAWPSLWGLGLFTIPFPRALAETTPSMTVRVPLDGPVRVFWGGDALAGNYHRATPEQAWAYDLVVEPAGTGATRNEDFGCFGRPVVAPARGVVAVAVDGRPDHPPGEPRDPANPAGNHVVLDLDGGFLLLGHLARESLAVREGDVVEEGQPLGRCGNSGNTSEPHVHLHLQREDPRTVTFGFAEGLPLFFRDHDGPSMPVGGFEEAADGGLRLIGSVVRHRGRPGDEPGAPAE